MRILIIAFSLGLSACNPTTMLQHGRWTGGGEPPAVNAVGLQAPTSVESSGERIDYSEQKIGNYPIEDSYHKLIFQGTKPVFQSFAVVEDRRIQRIEKKAKALSNKKEILWADFITENPKYKDLILQESVQVVIVNDQGNLTPAICGKMQEKAGNLFEACIDRKSKLLRERKLGSAMDDSQTKTLIFPKGPKHSDLASVLVPRILISEGVKSNWVEVNTEGPLKILKNSVLEIQPQDERFDQTQAFFFANQMFAWLEKNEILNQPVPLKITTQIGYPDKTNTAFYFGGRIRLGTGDDVVYSRIPWDPSIVMHEVSHAVIESIAHLPFEGEGGAINEGYADLFASFLLNNPHMGENSYKPAPFRRSADTFLKMSEKTGGLYHDAAIVSGFFWAQKSFLTDEKIIQYAVRVLNRLGPDTDFEKFRLTLKEQKDVLFSGLELQKINQLLKDRELE